MIRYLLPLFFLFGSTLAQGGAFEDLRQEATTALAKLAVDRAALKKAAGTDEKAQAELWDRHSYWTHFMDLVFELSEQSSKSKGRGKPAPSFTERLARARRTLHETGVRVESSGDGHVWLHPEPSSYSDRESALKSAAEVSVYARLQVQK